MNLGLNNLGLNNNKRFSPSRMFAGGEQGVWFDPSDLSSMYQDSAATTPVTAVGQPVGKILDKSGRGNHATQGTSASRPILRQDSSGYYYLEFDGLNYSMATSAIDFTATDKMTVVSGVHKASDVIGAIFETSADSSLNNGSLYLLSKGVSPNDYLVGVRGTTFIYQQFLATPPVTNVMSMGYDLSQAALATELTVRINGASGSVASTGGTDAGTGNFGNHVLYIGKRGGSTLPFNGRLYGLIVRGAATQTSDLMSLEKWMGQKTGIAL